MGYLYHDFGIESIKKITVNGILLKQKGIYTLAMDREDVRAAYKLAIDDGYKHAAVARATRIGVSSLKHFYSDDGNLGTESVEQLADWLSVRGFFNVIWRNQDPFQLVAIELRSLSETLRSGVEIDIKRSRLISFFDDWASIITGFKNTQKGSP